MGEDRELIYICSPYSGDIEGNTERAIAYSRFAVDCGYVPIAPHLLLPQFVSEKSERKLAMSMDMLFLSKCDELWAFGSYLSMGMQMEIAEAERLKIPVRFFTENMEEV